MRDTVDIKYLKYLFKGSLAININTQYIFSIFNYKYVDIFERKINPHYSNSIAVSVSKSKAKSVYSVKKQSKLYNSGLCTFCFINISVMLLLVSCFPTKKYKYYLRVGGLVVL